MALSVQSKGRIMPQNQPSKYWPVLQRSGKLLEHVKIPGTDLTFAKVIDVLAGIQNDMTQNQWQNDVKDALNGVLAHTATLVDELKQHNEHLLPEDLSEGMLALTERHHLITTANAYLYADFKGIEQDVNFVSLELDEVFVNLRAAPERAEAHDDDDGEKLRERLLQASADEREQLTMEFESLDAESARRSLRKGADTAPLSIDQLVSKPGGAVLLGGPGSGKTTLIKRLARSCALGPDIMRERYPEMPHNLFPIVVSITLFDAWRQDGRSVLDYIKAHLQQQGGQALLEVFDRCWRQDRCLILLDGLDEVAQADHRISSARAVDELYQELHGNRALTTSRIVGYNICRLSSPSQHAVLQPFDRDDIGTFVRQWHRAREQAWHSESPNFQQAAQDAEALLREIEANVSVASLASNPLMLTIIGLIKQRDVRLPERRVELYEAAMNTLLRSWNKARSLSGLTLGVEPRLERTKRVWAAVAYWMHEHTSRGALHRSQLHEQLVEVLTSDEFELKRHDAHEEAESYLNTAAESTGLLEARGPETFAFVHQTFQEYLAANRLAIPTRRAVNRILDVAGDPRWHEVIRLATGVIGVYQGDLDAMEELIDALLAENNDPLEPLLCVRLRLAAACIADDVGFRQRDINRVMSRIAERLLHLPAPWPITSALTDALRMLPVTQPERVSDEVIDLLCDLAGHSRWDTRMESARKLAEVADWNAKARQRLETLLQDSDNDVQAHAAVGLWQAGRTLQPLSSHIARGLRSPAAKMMLNPSTDGVRHWLLLLEAEDADVRSSAASVLGNWGHQAEALPALLGLLEDEDADVRSRAAEVLGDWGHQAEALPALLGLLEDEDAYVRLSVASVLGNWGHQAEAFARAVGVARSRGCLCSLERGITLGQLGSKSRGYRCSPR